MDREDILEQSRRENRGRDVADLESAKSGEQLGWAVASTLSWLVFIADMLVFQRHCYELPFTIAVGLCVVFAKKFVLLRKGHELVVSLLWGVTAAIWLLAWITDLSAR